MDLLEHETLDAIVNGGNSTTLPLRSRLLPSLDAVRDIDRRLCAGGPLALFAAARRAAVVAAESPTTCSWFSSAPTTSSMPPEDSR
jgi:hypothetical protein